MAMVLCEKLSQRETAARAHAWWRQKAMWCAALQKTHRHDPEDARRRHKWLPWPCEHVGTITAK